MTQYELDNELQLIRMEEQSAILDLQKRKVSLREQLSKELDDEDNQYLEKKNEIKYELATVDSLYVRTTDIEEKSKLKFKQCANRIDLTNISDLHIKNTQAIIRKFKTESLKLDNECSELHNTYNKRRLELRKQFIAEQKVTYPPLETANWDGDAKITRE